MGLFGDRLQLHLIVTTPSEERPYIRNIKQEKKVGWLLPFSCVSLIASQLTVLSYPIYLVNELLDFIDSPMVKYKKNRLIEGFELKLYEKNSNSHYNQFLPQTNISFSASDINYVERDIESILLNYIYAIYENLSSNEELKLRSFLLVTIIYYQQFIVPIGKMQELSYLEKRQKLAGTHLWISNGIYERWELPNDLIPGSPLFNEKFYEAKKG
jgi:hypothetical protein